MKKLFIEHPSSVGETYFEHLLMASRFSFELLIAALACLVHALLPFLFVKTGSQKIDRLYEKMVISRRGRDDQPADEVVSKV